MRVNDSKNTEVSIHSRLKAAGPEIHGETLKAVVSIHSRLKAAGAARAPSRSP